MSRSTHTYAILEVSPAAYDEIRAKLEAAGYEHAFHDGLVDMHGLALQRQTGGGEFAGDTRETSTPQSPADGTANTGALAPE